MHYKTSYSKEQFVQILKASVSIQSNCVEKINQYNLCVEQKTVSHAGLKRLEGE